VSIHQRRASDLREFAPPGVCDPPNPFIYRQLVALCGDGDELHHDGDGDSGGEHRPGHQLATDHRHQHLHLDAADLAAFEEDPDNRPYIWDLESCKCH